MGHWIKKDNAAKDIEEQNNILWPGWKTTDKIGHIGESHEITEHVARDGGEETTSSYEQIRGINAEHVGVAELKQVLGND